MSHLFSVTSVGSAHLIPCHTERKAQHHTQEVNGLTPVTVDEPTQQRILTCKQPGRQVIKELWCSVLSLVLSQHTVCVDNKLPCLSVTSCSVLCSSHSRRIMGMTPCSCRYKCPAAARCLLSASTIDPGAVGSGACRSPGSPRYLGAHLLGS